MVVIGLFYLHNQIVYKYYSNPFQGDLIAGLVGVVLPMVTFGVLAMVAGVFAIFLPETMGETLPDTIEQALELGKG
jgi:hypothetical protein